jgi:hypothetical protein
MQRWEATMAKRTSRPGAKRPTKARKAPRAKGVAKGKRPASLAKAKAPARRRAGKAAAAAALLRRLRARAAKLLAASPGLAPEEVVARVLVDFPQLDDGVFRPVFILPASGTPVE